MTEYLPAVAAFASIAGPGAVIWLQRRAFGKQDEAIKSVDTKVKAVSERMDCFEKSQHACQLANAKEFATQADLARLTDRVDAHSADIAGIKGRLKAE